MLGRRERTKRNGRGTRNGGAANTRTRDDQVAPVERLKLWFAALRPELPNGTVGRTWASGCFLTAFDSGGGRVSRRMLILDGPRTMASRTSEPGRYLSLTRKAEITRACSQSADSGTRAVGRAQAWGTEVFAGIARRGAGLADATVRSTVGSSEIAAGARRCRNLTIIDALGSVALVAAHEHVHARAGNDEVGAPGRHHSAIRSPARIGGPDGSADPSLTAVARRSRRPGSRSTSADPRSAGDAKAPGGTKRDGTRRTATRAA